MDIAEIGFRVHTSDLDKAVTKLNALAPAAAGVTAASTKMVKALEGASSNLARQDYLRADATLKRLRASENATKTELNSAVKLVNKTKKLYDAALAEDKLAQSIAARSAAESKANRVAFGAGSTSAIGSMQYRGPTLAVNNSQSQPTTPRDMMPNRFNTANIAAQFQDIGVTAAMGMNPLIIAMQQGTQVAAIMNSMQSPLAGLKQAFIQILNPISLMSIGLVALVATGLQMVDWAKVGQGALNLLADATEYLIPALIGLGAALLVLNFSAVVSGATSALVVIGSLTVAVGAAAKAFVAAGIAFAVANPLLTALAVIIGGLIATVGYLSGLFDQAGDAVRGWGASAKQANQDASGLSETFNKMTDEIYAQKGALMLAGQELDKYMIKEELWARNWPEIEKKFPKAGMEGRLEAIKELQAKMDELASSPSIQPLPEKKTAVAGAASGKTEAQKYKEITEAANRRIDSLKAEQAALGMSEQAAAKLRYETELLNDAQQKGVLLSPTQRAALGDLAAEMARIEANTKATKEALDFAKEATRGFFNDMKDGLQQGKSLWESFGNAVTNVLNRIFERMMNSGIDMLFGGSGGGGGILGSLLGIGGSGGAPIPGGVGPSQGTNGIFGSIASAFGFAKGGVFTNSIVNGATPFAFASGGAFGVMGEAGPEAVMPLHRGPDGSLGVKMAGGGNGNGTAVVVNINNYGDSKVSTQQRQTPGGTEIDVMIDEMIGQKISEQGSATNRSLNTRDSRRLISR